MLTWGSDSTCLGEIRNFHSPSLPVCSVSSVNSVSMDQTWLSNMNFLWKLAIVIPRLPCLLRMAKGVSSTTEQVKSVTSDSVDSFNFTMWAIASKWVPIEQVPSSDWRRSTGWQMVHMMAGFPVSSIPLSKWKCQEGACQRIFQAIRPFEPTFIEAHQASKWFAK